VTRRRKIEIWIQDEARIGQKNGLVRQWARRGTRPRQPADQRYESAYLFGAICPARGVGAALALPFADTSMMQLHIDEIALHVAKGAHAVLLLDRAGWHIAGDLRWPRNITPILLPSRSPELNPVEQVWQFLRANSSLSLRPSPQSECAIGRTQVSCEGRWYHSLISVQSGADGF
jgi:hypothetical protein